MRIALLILCLLAVGCSDDKTFILPNPVDPPLGEIPPKCLEDPCDPGCAVHDFICKECRPEVAEKCNCKDEKQNAPGCKP